MIINVKVKNKSISVSLGSGTQTFRWLAQVVTFRLKSEGVLRRTFEEDCRTVVGFKDADGNVINPNNTVCSVVDSNGVVFADVTDALPSDEFGNPVPSEWMVSAYVKSPHGIRWYTEMEAYRESQNSTKDGDDIQTDSLLYVGHFTVSDIDSAFQLDWQQMNWSWLGISESDTEHRELKLILRKKYGLLCRIFSHYCGPGKAGDTYGMSLYEFGHFVHTTGAINFRSHSKKIESIFYSVIDDATALSETTMLMTRVDFVYALVKVALRSADDSVRNVVDPVDVYLSGPIDDAWNSYFSKYHIYSLQNSLMQKTMEDYYVAVKSIFSKFAASSKSGYGLSYAAFKNLFVKTSTIEHSQDSIAKSAFVGSMPGYICHGQLNPDFEELVFAEFMESACIIAKSAISDSDISDVQKIRIVCHAIAELAAMDD